MSTNGSIDAAAVGDAVEQRYAALDGYDATVTRTVDVGDATATATANVTVRGDRRTVTYTAGPRAGETVTEAAGSGPVFTADTTSDRTVAPASYAALAESLVRTSNVSITRVSTYAGHRAAVVELTATANATTGDTANLTRTVWVDVDRKIPLKVVTSWTTADGQHATVTVEYSNVTLYDDNTTATTAGGIA